MLEIEDYLQSLYQRNYAAGTIQYRGIYLHHFKTYLEKHSVTHLNELTKSILFEYHKELNQSDWAAETNQSVLITLQSFFRFLYEQDRISVDLSRWIILPKKTERRIGNVLSEAVVTQFLALPDTTTPRGLRDKAMLELLYSSAIRREELIKLNLYDFIESETTLRVFGKGRKVRIVPVGQVAIQWLKKYLADVRRYYAASKEQSLFVSLVYGKRMTKEYVNMLFAQYRKQGMFTEAVTPHTMRHSCATHLIKSGADIRYVQELLGHSSARTTEIYTHLDITDLKTVYKRAHPRGIR